jgi:uncharacterized lipoprotein YmbA
MSMRPALVRSALRSALATLPLWALLACTTPPPAQLYRLRSEPPTPPSPAPAWAGAPWQLVLPVVLPEYLDRDTLVVPQGQAGLRTLPGQRWAEPLAEGVTRVLRADLAAVLGESALWAGPLPPGRVAAGQLRIELTAFETTADRSAVRLSARWSLAGTALVNGRSEISVPVAAPDVDALVAAHREALWRLALEMALAVRAAR